MESHRHMRRRTGVRSLAIALAVGAAAATASGCDPQAAEARTMRTACEGGDAAACNELGYRVRQGRHVLADWRSAAALFGRACEGGEGEGCVRLAELHVHPSAGSRGVVPDSGAAVDLFERGCDLGAPVGCTELASLILAAQPSDSSAAALADSALAWLAEAMGGALPDASDAAGLYERACDAGELVGCTRLGLLYGEGRGVEVDASRAAALHRRACDGDSPLGCAHLGRSYETGLGVAPDVARAATLYEDACEEEMTGCYRLAGLLETGAGVERDYDRAVELYVKACYGTMRRDEGSPPIPESCLRLGDMYTNGTGVDGNPFLASRYLRRACSLGIESACGRS